MEYKKPENYDSLKDSITTKAINKEWIEKFNATSLNSLFLMFFVLLVAGSLTDNAVFYISAFVTMITGGALSLSNLFLFYNAIKCPSCGFKLNKLKNGKNKPWTQAKDHLQIGKPCPMCGWDPNEYV